MEKTSEISVTKIRRKKGQVAKRQGGEAAGKPVSTLSLKYTKLSIANKKWVAETGLKTKQSATAIVNAAIDSVRTGAKFKLEAYTPKYLLKAQAAEDRKLERFKRMAAEF